MRLYVPNKVTEENNSDEEEVNENGSNKGAGETRPSAEVLKEEIMKYANVGTLGEAIAHVPEVPMITPRGKFDLYMLKNVLKILWNYYF